MKHKKVLPFYRGKMVRKAVALAVVAAMTASFMAAGNIATAGSTADNTYDAGYVGLGDSIARGYGNYKGESAVDMLGSLLLDRGHAKNAKVRYDNFAQDGDHSSHLLSKLKNSPQVVQAVKDSSFITISIGGNNIMFEMGRQVAVAVGIDPDTNSNYTSDAVDYITANPVSGSAKVLSRFNSSEFKAIMAEKIAGFRGDMQEIAKQIKKLNPNTKIIVQTLYCPTKFVFLSSFLDGYITQINDAIKEFAPGNYTVVDIHNVFKNYSGSEDLTYTAVMKGLFDPHPTAAGQKLIYDNLLPQVESIINNLPTRSRTPQYQSFGNLRENVKYAFDFDSSAFTAGTSIFSSGNTAKNYIDVGGSASGMPSAYDLKIVNTDHIKGLEFTMSADYDCSPITLKLNSAVNGTAFLSGRKTIPADSTDHGLLFYVDTRNYTGQKHIQLQFDEIDVSGSTTRRGLLANSEAYMQDANGNFALPVSINANDYLILPENYAGYIAVPFNSFKTIWSTKDTNFAVDLKNVQNIYIYRGSNAGGGKLVFDEFIFYGKGITSNTYTAQAGQAKTTGLPENTVSLFDFEDNRFIAGKSLTTDGAYRRSIDKYLSPAAVNNPPQYAMSVIPYNGVNGRPSGKALSFETLSNQSASGQYMGLSLNTRQELGLYEKVTPYGNLVSSSSESDGIAFYIDLTGYQGSYRFDLNVTWHETDCDANGLPVMEEQSGGVKVELNTSRNLNELYGQVEGVLDNGTSVSLPLSGNTVTFPKLADGSNFKGWVKLPFAAFQTCWGSADVNGAVDFYDIFGLDLYYGSYPSRLGSVILDEFCFYGPAFAQIASQSKCYVPKADMMDLQFNANGTVTDAAGKATVQKVNGPLVASKSVSHQGENYTANALQITQSGQGLMANFSGITSRDIQHDWYAKGFTVESFGVNYLPNGEQSFVSSAQNGGWGLFTTGSGAKFITNTADTYTEAYTQGTLPQNQLVHLVGTYDFSNSRLCIYVNGELDRILSISGDFTAGFGEAYNKVSIGGDVDYYGQLTQSLMTNAAIVSAKIYSEPLNTLQVQQAYANAVNALA